MKKLLGLIALAFIVTLTLPAAVQAQGRTLLSRAAEGTYAWGRDGWCYVLTGGQWVRTDYSRTFPFRHNPRVYDLFQGKRFLQRVVENPAPWEAATRLAQPRRAATTSPSVSLASPSLDPLGPAENPDMGAPSMGDPGAQTPGASPDLSQNPPQELPQELPQGTSQAPSQGTSPMAGNPGVPGGGIAELGNPTSMPGVTPGRMGQSMKAARIAAAFTLLGQIINPSIQ
jgi:hypothetical protein